jgi:hypothetical protein
VVLNLGPQRGSRQESKPVVATTVPAVAKPSPIAIKPVPIVRTKQVRRQPARSNGAELIAAFDALSEDRTAKVSAHPGQTVITMQTEDPSVTILFLTDSNGDGE